MRRMIITAIALTGLVVPGAAIASHQGEHQRRADERGINHHKRHHHHAHVVRFGSAAAMQPASPSGSTQASGPGASAGETAGTIASFTGATLTITLNDGSTVSAKITEDTEIECRATTARAASDDGSADDNDQGDDRGQDGRLGSSSGGEEQGDVSGREGDDNGDGQAAPDEAEHCTTAALAAGTVVREAELRVSSAGSVWQKVELGQ
jgi:hypothetical protein